MANFQDMWRFLGAIGGYFNKFMIFKKKSGNNMSNEPFPYHLIGPTKDYNFLDNTHNFIALDFGNPPNENPWGTTPVTLTSASGSYYNNSNPLPVIIGGTSGSTGIVNVSIVSASGPLAVSINNTDNLVATASPVSPLTSTINTPFFPVNPNISASSAIISYNVTSIINGQSVILKFYYTDGAGNLIQIAQSATIFSAGSFIYVFGLGANYNNTFGTTVISSQSIPVPKQLTLQEVFSNTSGAGTVIRSIAVSYVI